MFKSAIQDSSSASVAVVTAVALVVGVVAAADTKIFTQKFWAKIANPRTLHFGKIGF